MNIREYQETDKQALKDITLRAWEPVFAGLEGSMSKDIYEVFVPDWEAEQMRSLNAVCDDAAIDVIVAEQDQQIVGFAAMSYHPEDYLGQIYMIGVDPECQQQGIGTTLMEKGIAMIKAKGFSLVMVETGGDPGHASARATYEKMGFELCKVARYLKRI
ncbi:MAG: GNAT family N-acetyltransferase [Pseudomonadales bacterium]|nr:GNAT family N-acetyltransferase [Pseudomonadales bacterium]